MQIPKSLPQFSGLPVLFIASGAYEALFYMAHNGSIERIHTIKMPPREEAREKQAFVGKKGGMQSLSSVSHHGAYVIDLKKKFQREVHAAVHDLLAGHKLEEIYLFSPHHSAKRLMAGLDKAERKKVRMQFFSTYTKLSPVQMVKTFWRTEQEAIKFKTPPKSEVKKILQKRAAISPGARFTVFKRDRMRG